MLPHMYAHQESIPQQTFYSHASYQATSQYPPMNYSQGLHVTTSRTCHLSREIHRHNDEIIRACRSKERQQTEKQT
jgi:hypothetical protein